MRTSVCWQLLVIIFLPLQSLWAGSGQRPNIIFVLCDDLGYGDIKCLSPETSKIPTPHADRLARQGMIFTDAHSGSSVCTPTRYGLMTGRYSWRSKLQSGVVQGYAPSLIPADRPTVADFLKKQGYHTGIVGKWHLNFQYLAPETGDPLKRPRGKDALPPIGATIPDGPIDRGFDYFHGFHHSRDMKAVIENDVVIAHEPVIEMLPRLAGKAVDYIDRRVSEDSSHPFFLYVPLSSPHTPIVPSRKWQGKSNLGKYGDFVMQTDDALGAILAALEQHNLTDNTIVIFTSDNGCSKAAGIPGLAEQGHLVSAQYRGSKADLWEGGHRVPFIVRWPGQIEDGSTSDSLICLTDLFATLGELTNHPLPEGSAEDSVSFLPALFGNPINSTRAGVVHHSISGHFAYRLGPWKLLLARGSGGWTSPKENQVPADAPVAQLYNLEEDPGETRNLYQSRTDIARKLLKQLKDDVERGRSTEGPAASNDLDNIVLWKSGKGPVPSKSR